MAIYDVFPTTTKSVNPGSESTACCHYAKITPVIQLNTGIAVR